ncbi:MAG TPA: phage head-tail connector protein [Allosphingosinicella sp.]|nr:phage head-tail connector protein [Allosphingosinicella sp.]
MGQISAGAPLLPISLAELKAFLRVTVSDEDALLAGLARGAADLCEAFTGRALIERAVEEVLTASARWTRLGAAPVRSIEGVAALAGDGEASPLAAGAFATDVDAAGDGWVRVTDAAGAKKVLVSYRAGMAADPNGLPEALRHGIVRLAAHLYSHRDEAEQAGPPAAVTALWRPWRRLRLR